LVQKWVDCNGEEETVSRLKVVKDAFLHHLVGQKIHIPWIRQHKSGKPKGPLGVLWRFHKRDLFKVWNALMVYSAMTYSFKGRMPRITARQYSKFIKAVNRPHVDVAYKDVVTVLIENFMSCYEFPKFKATTGVPIVSLHGSSTRRAPCPQGYLATRIEEEALVSSIGVLALRPEFTRKHFQIYSGVLTGFEETWTGFAWTYDNSTDRPLSGRIGIIQEPGYKARVVANPYRVHQAAMLPLKDYLFSLLRKLLNDYVYNQEAGVQYVQNLLNEGKTLYSVDLANASDNLPLEFQVRLLSRLGVSQDWIDCFVAISSGDWEMPSDWLPPEKDVRKYLPKDNLPNDGFYPYNGERYLRWYVGQPLGLGPSFASAFLLHHAIVVGCHVFLNKELQYAMVGDDLVLADLDVYNMYRWIMDAIGVQVSKEKTLVSDRAGEFLSRIIFKSFVLRGYKWKGSGDNSFIDVARSLGPRSIRLFMPRQRAVLRVLGELPEPYGLGWNPKGRSWWDRMEEWLEALEHFEVQNRSYVSTVSSLNRKLYAGNLRFMTDKGYPLSAIPDQGIEAFVSSTLSPTVGRLGELMIPNLDYLARLCDDVRSRSSWDREIPISQVFAFLKDFTVLEKIVDITALIRAERLIASVRRV
jgi:hypothetical protein